MDFSLELYSSLLNQRKINVIEDLMKKDNIEVLDNIFLQPSSLFSMSFKYLISLKNKTNTVKQETILYQDLLNYNSGIKTLDLALIPLLINIYKINNNVIIYDKIISFLNQDELLDLYSLKNISDIQVDFLYELNNEDLSIFINKLKTKNAKFFKNFHKLFNSKLSLKHDVVYLNYLCAKRNSDLDNVIFDKITLEYIKQQFKKTNSFDLFFENILIEFFSSSKNTLKLQNNYHTITNETLFDFVIDNAYYNLDKIKNPLLLFNSPFVDKFSSRNLTILYNNLISYYLKNPQSLSFNDVLSIGEKYNLSINAKKDLICLLYETSFLNENNYDNHNIIKIFKNQDIYYNIISEILFRNLPIKVFLDLQLGAKNLEWLSNINVNFILNFNNDILIELYLKTLFYFKNKNFYKDILVFILKEHKLCSMVKNELDFMLKKNMINEWEYELILIKQQYNQYSALV